MSKELDFPKLENQLSGLTPVGFGEKIQGITDHLQSLDGEEEITKTLTDTNITHHFAEGLYGRELLIPKGVLIVSRVHKRPLINVISKGHVIILDVNGRREVHAPATFVDEEAGTQRVVYSVEETVWTTTHPTDLTTEEGMLEEMTTASYSEFLEYSKVLEVL